MPETHRILPKTAALHHKWRVAASVLLALAGWSAAHAAVPATRTPDVYLLSPGILVKTRQRVMHGDAALQPALASLKAAADKELGGELAKVTDKPADIAGMVGGKHNYASVSVYFWPDEKDPSAPWLMRDGQPNKEMIAKYDGGRMSAMLRRVTTCGLAYYFTNDRNYARRAAAQLRAWFLDPATRMNPNMDYAQCVPNKSKGSPWGVIDANGMSHMLDSVALLAGSGEWNERDNAALKQWFGEFSSWLTTSDLGRRERAAKNNHGTFYDLLLARTALFAGNEELARDVVQQFGPKRIATQVLPDGSTPHEQGRVDSASYTCWNLSGYADMLVLGRRLGIDLWQFRTTDGRSIRRAAEWFIPYVEDPAKWTFGNRKFSKTSPSGFFWMISAVTGDPKINRFFRSHMTPPNETGWHKNIQMLRWPMKDLTSESKQGSQPTNRTTTLNQIP